MKLPAFGKTLLEARRAGRHPATVVVIYGDDWSRPADLPGMWGEDFKQWPLIAVKPSDYQPGRYHWHLVQGCWVLLYARTDSADWLWLMGELAVVAGMVTVRASHAIFAECDRREARAEEIAAAYKTGPLYTETGWPPWWSELARNGRQRENQWWEDRLADIEEVERRESVRGGGRTLSHSSAAQGHRRAQGLP